MQARQINYKLYYDNIKITILKIIYIINILITRLGVTYAIIIVTEFEPIEAGTFERSHGIETSAVIAHIRVTTALVYVYARVASRGERVSVVTNALETPVQIRAFAIPAYSFSFVTFVNVCSNVTKYCYIF